MTRDPITRRETLGFTVVSWVLLVAAGVVGLRFTPPASTAVRWVVVGLLAAVGAVRVLAARDVASRLWMNVYLAVDGALIAALMFIQPGWTMYPVLFTSPISWAVLRLPPRHGTYWIAAYTLVTAASFAFGISPGEGVMALFLYGVLYSFMGAFAGALARAEAARRDSQHLLADLQEAHARLRDDAGRAEELAVVEERNRLAREMHDTLGHRLTVAAVQLEGAQRLCATDPERSAAMVGTVREQVREALAELRSTVAALRAPIEVDLHLRTSLRRLAAHFEQATGLSVHLVLPDGLPPLPGEHRVALFRAAQEALTNVQRHAGAGQVWLVLSATETSIALLVGDDGHGLDPDSGNAGFGLSGLRERAAALGGELYLEPRRGGGTQLTLRLPLPQEASPGA